MIHEDVIRKFESMADMLKRQLANARKLERRKVFLIKNPKWGSTYIARVQAYSSNIVRFQILACTNPCMNWCESFYYSDSRLDNLETVPESDFPLYVGWNYINPRFEKILKKGLKRS
jgi:hypothetical protein